MGVKNNLQEIPERKPKIVLGIIFACSLMLAFFLFLILCFSYDIFPATETHSESIETIRGILILSIIVSLSTAFIMGVLLAKHNNFSINISSLLSKVQAIEGSNITTASKEMDSQKSFKFTCPHCAQELEATLEMIGMTLDCPECNKEICVHENNKNDDVNNAPALPLPKNIPPIDKPREKISVKSPTDIYNPTDAGLANKKISVVDINNSSEDAIAELPGIGPVLAKKVVSVRQSKGGFSSVEEFVEALDIKPHIVERIRPLIEIGTLKPPKFHPADNGGRMVDF